MRYSNSLQTRFCSSIDLVQSWKIYAISIIGTKNQLQDRALVAEYNERVKRKRFASPTMMWVYRCRLSKLVSLFPGWFGISPWSGGDSRTSVKPDSATSACSYHIVAGGDLSSSLLTRSASYKRAPALAASSSHLCRVISPLRRSRLFRMYFFSVNDVPRDNGTAGACRNRHHGGGKMAHAALREAAPVRFVIMSVTQILIAIVQFLRSFIAASRYVKREKKKKEKTERKTIQVIYMIQIKITNREMYILIFSLEFPKITLKIFLSQVKLRS